MSTYAPDLERVRKLILEFSSLATAIISQRAIDWYAQYGKMDGFVGNAPFRLIPPLRVGAQGVDTSHFNGRIDWGKVKAFGIEWCAIRATLGESRHDNEFPVSWPAARLAGLQRTPYHLFFGSLDPLEQASNFWWSVAADPGELPPIVDVEIFESDPPPDPAIYTARLKAFLEATTANFGRKPLIYTNPNSWNTLTTRPAWASEYGLIVADYDEPLTLTRPWTKAWARQYAIGAAGSVPGIVGRIDRDVYWGDAGQPAPVEPPIPPTPAPLYRARTLGDLSLRDAAGNRANHPTLAPGGAVLKGREVDVWKEMDVPGFARRAAITPDGLNIWRGAAGAPTLEKIP